MLRNGIFSAVSVNRDVSSCSHHSGELLSPEGIQEGKNTHYLAAIRLQPLPMVSPKEAQDLKTVIGPR